MKLNKGNVLIIIPSLIAVVALFLAGYFFLQNQQLQKPKDETVVPTLTPIVDETANWKTYENKKLGFSIKIPSNEIVTESPLGSDWISVRLEKTGLTIANSPPSIGDPAFKKEIKRQAVALSNGITLTLVLSRMGLSPFEKDGYGDVDEISIDKNANFTSKFYINAKVPHADSESKFNLIAQILGTFRFLDSAKCSSGLTMYEGKYFGICYPASAGIKEDVYPDSHRYPGNPDVRTAFTLGTEELIVSSSFLGGWGGDPCMSSSTVKINGVSSSRTVWKNGNSDGSCDSNYIKGLLTLVGNNVEKWPYPYLIDYRNGTNKLDLAKYIEIEQSFRIK